MTRPVAILGTGGHARVLVSFLDGARMIAPETEPGAGEPLVFGFTDTTLRRKLAERHGPARFIGAVHPTVWLPWPWPHPNLQAMQGALMQPGTQIGNFVVLNTGAQVDHDCVLEDYAVVGPGAVLVGHVTVREGAFIGANATVLGQRVIGTNAIVGAGAVVTRDVKPNEIVAGNPARHLRFKRADE